MLEIINVVAAEIEPVWTAVQPIIHGVVNVATIAGVAAALAAGLPPSTTPGVYAFVRTVIDAFAFNFGNAKNAK